MGKIWLLLAVASCGEVDLATDSDSAALSAPITCAVTVDACPLQPIAAKKTATYTDQSQAACRSQAQGYAVYCGADATSVFTDKTDSAHVKTATATFRATSYCSISVGACPLHAAYGQTTFANDALAQTNAGEAACLARATGWRDYCGGGDTYEARFYFVGFTDDGFQHKGYDRNLIDLTPPPKPAPRVTPTYRQPTPIIHQLDDGGSGEAPTGVFVDALDPRPHTCRAGGVDVESGTMIPLGHDLDAAQLSLMRTVRACLRARDIAYIADQSTKYLGGGNPAAVNFKWTFDDPQSGTYNVASGPSAAHFYAQSGPHTISLTVTNEAGLTKTVYKNINVGASTRSVVQIGSQSAFDAFVSRPSPGNQDIQLARGMTFRMSGHYASDGKTLLQQVFALGSNDHLSAYGTGADPIVLTTFDRPSSGASVGGKIFSLAPTTPLHHVVVAGIEVRVASGTLRPSVADLGGKGLVFKSVRFSSDPNTAHPAYVGPYRAFGLSGDGMLIQDVGMTSEPDATWITDGLGANFTYISGNHVALYGNSIYAASTDGNAEPAVRSCGGAEFVAISHNRIGGYFGKANEISLRGGSSTYVSDNEIRGGVWEAHVGCSDLYVAGESMSNIVFENNRSENSEFQLRFGVFNASVRNNVMHIGAVADPSYPTQGAIAMEVSTTANPMYGAPADGIRITNNSIFFEKADGKLLSLSPGVAGAIDLVNNLFYVTQLSHSANKQLFEINMPPNATQPLAALGRVNGNTFLINPRTTLATAIIAVTAGTTTVIDWQSWNASLTGLNSRPTDLAFPASVGDFSSKFAAELGDESESIEAYRPLAAAPFARQAQNLASAHDDSGVAQDFTGITRFATGGWTPGALQVR